MKIVWITGRRVGVDLAASTEVGLCKSLSLTNQICMISPGKTIISDIYKHFIVPQSKFRGLQSISAGTEVKRILKNEELADWADIFLVDWRLVGSVIGLLREREVPWCIIDRGPPADRGLIATLQSLQWRRSWKMAGKYAMGGFVVSSEHESFVRERVTIGIRIVSLPAGTEIERFAKNLEKPDDSIQFVYSGRLDSSRGINEMIRLVEYFDRLPLRASLKIIGKGNESHFLEEMSSVDERIVFLGEKDREEVWEELEKCHVGILPMPESKIWRTSSPLKLAEYLAAGLLVIGPRHPGNSIGGENRWELLSENSDWPESCIELVARTIESEDWGDISKEAREVAKSFDWNLVSEKLVNSLDLFLNS